MSQLVEKAELFVFNLFKDHLAQTFLYHNFTHTQRVLKSAQEIVEHSNLNEKDIEIIALTALFHDTGYIKTTNGHEEESVAIATQFLKDNNASASTIEAVGKCILATKLNHVPKDELEKIIRDADTSHFGKIYFNEASEFLRKELDLQNIKHFSPSEWRVENIEVLSTKHQFYTDYALSTWQPVKEENLKTLINEKHKRDEKLKTEELKAKYKAQYKSESPDRGVQTFYRVALRNHIKLSDIADTKANILLSVNAIIISLVLSNLFSKLDNPSNAYMIVPTAIFTFSSVVSMVLSIIATRPNITSGKFSKEDVKNKDVNLAFFGNFHKMAFEDYEWAVGELIKDRDYIYRTMTKDLYFLGKVLDRKYKILRVTYACFMVGTVISVLAFAIASNGQTKNVKKKATIKSEHRISYGYAPSCDAYCFNVANRSS